MTWTKVWIDVDGEHCGYVLESDDGIVSFESDGRRLVPVFSTLENAALYAHEQGATLSAAPGGFHDLAALAAFVEDARGDPPPHAFDDWILLDEVAFAAERGEKLASPHDHEAGLRVGASSAARAAAREAVAAALGVVRSVLVFLDRPR